MCLAQLSQRLDLCSCPIWISESISVHHSHIFFGASFKYNNDNDNNDSANDNKNDDDNDNDDDIGHL